MKEFAPGSKLTVTLKHKDGSEDSFEVEHTYNDTQIAWFKAGSALNLLQEIIVVAMQLKSNSYE